MDYRSGGRGVARALGGRNNPWRGGGGPGGRSGRGRNNQRRGGRHGPSQHTQERRNLASDYIQEFGDKSTGPCVSIAVEGCCHGELDTIYRRIELHEQQTQQKIDLLLCCGDFQSLRNAADFHSLAVPNKYRALGSFFKYYSGEKVAPVLTVFVGGNHEASQPLMELPYGGWVAPNIFYMGNAGVLSFHGITIGGISGIYKPDDFMKGRFETPPLSSSEMRTAYHVRNIDVHRLKCFAATAPTDIVLSHDWPQGVEQHGALQGLLRCKPFFRAEVERNDLGSPANRELLYALRPQWWFAAHLHVKFEAMVRHHAAASPLSLVPSQAICAPVQPPPSTDSSEKSPNPDKIREEWTHFVSLDKCLPRRQYLTVVHFPVDQRLDNPQLEYFPAWLAVLKETHNLISATTAGSRLPEPTSVGEETLAWIRERFKGSFAVPQNFEPTVPPHQGPAFQLPTPLPPPYGHMGNPQTDALLELLELDHVTTVPYRSSAPFEDDISGENQIDMEKAFMDDNEIEIEDNDDDDNYGKEEDHDPFVAGRGDKRPRIDNVSLTTHCSPLS